MNAIAHRILGGVMGLILSALGASCAHPGSRAPSADVPGAECRLDLRDLLRRELRELTASDRFRCLELTLRRDSTLTWYRDGRPCSPRKIEREYTALQGVLVVHTSVYERGGSTNELITAVKIKADDIGKRIGKGVIVTPPFPLTEVETPEKLEASWGRADAYGLDGAGTGSVAYESAGRSYGAVFRYEHKRLVEITLQKL